MAQLKEGSVIKKSTGDEVIATVTDLSNKVDKKTNGLPTTIVYGSDTNHAFQSHTGGYNWVFKSYNGTKVAFGNHDLSKKVIIDSNVGIIADQLTVPVYSAPLPSGGAKGIDVKLKGTDSNTHPQYGGGHGGNVILEVGKHTDNSQGRAGNPGDVVIMGYDYNTATKQEVARIEGDTGDINIEGAYKVNGIEGVSGTFQSQDGKTVTVTKGLITGIV